MEDLEESVPTLLFWQPTKVSVVPKASRQTKVLEIHFVNCGCIYAKIPPQDSLWVKQLIGSERYYLILEKVLSRVFAVRFTYEVFRWVLFGLVIFSFYDALLELLLGNLVYSFCELAATFSLSLLVRFCGFLYIKAVRKLRLKLYKQLKGVLEDIYSDCQVGVVIGSLCEWIKFEFDYCLDPFDLIGSSSSPNYPPVVEASKTSFQGTLMYTV